MIRWAFLLPLFILGQDSGDPIYHFLAKTKDKERAAKARAAVLQVMDDLDHKKKTDPIWTAVYLIITHGAADRSWLSSKDAKKVSAHLKSIRLGLHHRLTKAQHLAYAKKLMGRKDGPMRVMALGHLDAAGDGDHSAIIKAGKLRTFMDGRIGDERCVELARILREMSTREPLRVAMESRYKKSKHFEVRYVRLACLLKGVPKKMSLAPELFNALKALKSEDPAERHVEALSAGLEVYLKCDACKGKRIAGCSACNGKGVLEIVCQYCEGAGQFEETQPGGGTIYRACPACLNKNARRTDTCKYCSGKRTVPCERCKFLIPKYEDLVAEKKCARCDGKGLLFTRAAYPCFACRGLGLILEPAADPEATVSPRE
jgi:hypothetical protein